MFLDADSAEQDRPLFRGDLIPSPIDGQMIRYFPAHKKRQRINFAIVSISSFCVNGYCDLFVHLECNSKYDLLCFGCGGRHLLF
jgi:hypothetical protein